MAIPRLKGKSTGFYQTPVVQTPLPWTPARERSGKSRPPKSKRPHWSSEERKRERRGSAGTPTEARGAQAALALVETPFTSTPITRCGGKMEIPPETVIESLRGRNPAGDVHRRPALASATTGQVTRYPCRRPRVGRSRGRRKRHPSSLTPKTPVEPDTQETPVESDTRLRNRCKQ